MIDNEVLDLTPFRLSVSFSGGGFRAAFFSLGAYRRLVEVGCAEIVGRLSSVSGGSITAAKVAVETSRAPFASIEDFDQRVTLPITRLGQMGLRRVIMSRWRPWQMPRTSFSVALIDLLDEHVFGGETLAQLGSKLELTINATSLHTGRRYRFKRTDMGDSTHGITEDIQGISVAFAVACSAAFPMMFAPIRLETRGRTFHAKHWDVEKKHTSTPPAVLWLTDGGVYDNLGSEPLLSADVPFLIVDASKFAERWDPDTTPSYFARTWRPLDTGLDQVVSLRRRLLYDHAVRVGGLLLMLRDPISLLAQGTRHGRFDREEPAPLASVPELDPELQALLASMRTDLDVFSDIEIACLMWAGAARMHVALTRHLTPHVPLTPHGPPNPPSMSVAEMRSELEAGQKRSYFGRGSEHAR